MVLPYSTVALISYGVQIPVEASILGWFYPFLQSQPVMSRYFTCIFLAESVVIAIALVSILARV